MAVGNFIFAVLTALVAVNFTFAEENPLEPSDFGSRFRFYDEVDGNENHGPPSEVNDNEETQERSFLSGFSIKIPCDITQGRDYCISCRKTVHCVSSTIGIVTKCHDHKSYCNEGKCSDTPGRQC